MVRVRYRCGTGTVKERYGKAASLGSHCCCYLPLLLPLLLQLYLILFTATLLVLLFVLLFLLLFLLPLLTTAAVFCCFCHLMLFLLLLPLLLLLLLLLLLVLRPGSEDGKASPSLSGTRRLLNTSPKTSWRRCRKSSAGHRCEPGRAFACARAGLVRLFRVMRISSACRRWDCV